MGNFSMIRAEKGIAVLILAVLPLSLGAIEISVVNTSGRPVADAVVALYGNETSDSEITLPMTAEVDQRQRQFVPYVAAVRAGTKIHFPNSDNIRHHVYSFSPAKRFELRLYHGSTAEPVLFDRAGKVVLGCNIHDDMIGYIYVVETPFFAVTDSEGVAEFRQLPDGEIRYEIQHPQLIETIEGKLPTTAGPHRLSVGVLAADPRQQPPQTELEALFDR